MLILAKVHHPWSPPALSTVDLLNLPTAKRRTLLGRVTVTDADPDSSGAPIVLDRFDVLPLPRTHGEATVWGRRAKKQSRVWGMYTDTTSFYAGTSLDNTTYCRGLDDVVVVQFDGDEDESGVIPGRHVPARFCTLMGSEDPLGRVGKKKRERTGGGRGREKRGKGGRK